MKEAEKEKRGKMKEEDEENEEETLEEVTLNLNEFHVRISWIFVDVIRCTL